MCPRVKLVITFCALPFGRPALASRRSQTAEAWACPPGQAGGGKYKKRPAAGNVRCYQALWPPPSAWESARGLRDLSNECAKAGAVATKCRRGSCPTKAREPVRKLRDLSSVN